MGTQIIKLGVIVVTSRSQGNTPIFKHTLNGIMHLDSVVSAKQEKSLEIAARVVS